MDETPLWTLLESCISPLLTLLELALDRHMDNPVGIHNGVAVDVLNHGDLIDYLTSMESLVGFWARRARVRQAMRVHLHQLAALPHRQMTGDRFWALHDLERNLERYDMEIDTLEEAINGFLRCPHLLEWVLRRLWIDTQITRLESIIFPGPDDNFDFDVFHKATEIYLSIEREFFEHYWLTTEEEDTE